MNKDLAVGLVGALVLIGSMTGIFLYERTHAVVTVLPPGTEGASPERVEMNLTGPAAEGVAPLRGESAAELRVTQGNLTRVTFTLTWTATNGKDTLKLRVTPPPGAGASVESQEEDDGTLTLEVALPTNVTAPHEAGVGNWKVTVAYLRGTGVVPGAPQPVQPDPSVAWELTTDLHHTVPKA